MSKGNIYLYSPVALEPWDWRNPDTKGIGGSETAHIETAKGLAKRGYTVHSFTHLPPSTKSSTDVTFDVVWRDITEVDTALENAPENSVWLVYRDIHIFNKDLPTNQKYWFIAQDVIYDFTEEQLAKIDRYICLCRTHAAFTAEKFPSIKDRIYISTNGIRRDLIESIEANERIIRDPYRLIYTSSPDRGLAMILEQWFRIKERVPQASLHIYYGFNNMDEIINKLGGQSDLVETKRHLMDLMLQPGITFKGRANQPELVAAMFEAQLWAAPHSWPETSCITCMEMMATGVVPITNNHWALKDNVFAGVLLPCIPQDNKLMAAIWVEEVIRTLQNYDRPDKIRKQMMIDSRDSFSWDKIIDSQLVPWIEEDLHCATSSKPPLSLPPQQLSLVL